MKKICICGGGSLGHVCAGVLASQDDVEVNIYTQKPERWNKQITVTDNAGKIYSGNISCISNNAEEALKDCDIILLCLPGYAIESTLERIKPFIGKAIIGSIVSSTGFFFVAHKVVGSDAKLFGFQRVPFIARTVEYGHSARLLGYKSNLAIAIENIDDAESFKLLVEKLWMTPVRLLNSYYDASLTNSNPILHTGRLYTMWKDWNGEVYGSNTYFYKDWTIEASQLLIDMDAEFMRLLDVLPVTKGAIPSLLDYYESHDAESLTHSLSSIEAFQNILSPMKDVEGGWIPDFQSRYFTEDFPYGLKYIVDFAKEKNIDCPNLSKVFEWGMSKCKI